MVLHDLLLRDSSRLANVSSVELGVASRTGRPFTLNEKAAVARF